MRISQLPPICWGEKEKKRACLGFAKEGPEQMGASLSQAIQAVLDNPEGQAEAHKAFDALDENKDGQLSLAEWEVASKALWEAIRGGAEQHVKQDVRTTVAGHAPAMKGLVGKMAAQAVALLAEQSDPDHAAWTREMFTRADKDASGALSFDEFVAFFAHDAPRERAQREAELREAVAANIDEHHGVLDVRVQKGAVTKSVNVAVPGLTGDEIRRTGE